MTVNGGSGSGVGQQMHQKQVNGHSKHDDHDHHDDDDDDVNDASSIDGNSDGSSSSIVNGVIVAELYGHYGVRAQSNVTPGRKRAQNRIGGHRWA